MSDDDDIIIGPQKMSLKCPVSDAIPVYNSPHTFFPADFYEGANPLPVFQMRAPPMLRCYFLVFHDGADDNVVCPVCEKSLDHKDLIIDGYIAFL